MQTMNAVQAAHILLLAKVKTAAVLLDGTAGNGNDTLFLAQNSPDNAVIYAFDVQTAALEKTRIRLAEEKLLNKVELILDSHANLDNYITDRIDAAVFNLGYLPGAAHELTTLWSSTLEAVQKVLQKLSVNGVLIVTAYPGHEAGLDEQQKLEEFFAGLDKKTFIAVKYQMINHAANAPVCYLAERVK